jgi:VanZ family protein
MGGLFLLSSLPHPPAIPVEGSDKLAHLALYAGLAGVSLRALAAGRWDRVTTGTCVGAILLAVAYGAADEFHQSFVENRTSEVADLVADAVGAAAAAVGSRVWGILRTNDE